MTWLSEVPERTGYKNPFSLVHGTDLEYPVPGSVPVVKRIHIGRCSYSSQGVHIRWG